MDMTPDYSFLAAEQARQLAAQARALAAKMRGASEGLPPDGKVTIAIAQFRKLAALLEGLSGHAEAGYDSAVFDQPVEGIRFWVPAPEVERDRAELEALRKANAILAAQLREANAEISESDDASGATDRFGQSHLTAHDPYRLGGSSGAP